jgi:hypothetical protein
LALSRSIVFCTAAVCGLMTMISPDAVATAATDPPPATLKAAPRVKHLGVDARVLPSISTP